MKAQLQLMESTIVLFIFFLIIIVGLVVYTNFQTSRLDKINKQVNEQKATEVARKVLFTPELECSNNNARTMDCFEIQKLQPFVDIVKLRPRYFREEFGSTKISIRWVYAPAFTGLNPAPEFFTSTSPLFYVDVPQRILFDFSAGSTNKKTYYFPITLWDKTFTPEKNYFGWLIIEAYS